MKSNTSIQQGLQQATAQLQGLDTTANLDAELLLAHVLQKPRSYLYAYPEQYLSNEQVDTFQQLLQQRINGMSISYLLGYQEFWSLTLQVNQHTLIPRPETEQLVELALRYLDQQQPLHIADLGTGSGAIACALASECPNWHITATDNHPATLAVAQSNAKRLQLSNITFCLGDWCAALAPKQTFAAILSNPPYLGNDDQHLTQLRYEPREALVANHHGLAALQSIIKQASTHLLKQGWLMLEHGCTQATDIHEQFTQQNYKQVTHFEDLAGLSRITIGQTPL